MSEFLGRWKGYTHQSWHERFVELDRMYSHEAQYNIKALTTLHGTISQQAATIAELRTGIHSIVKELRSWQFKTRIAEPYQVPEYEDFVKIVHAIEIAAEK